MRNICTYPILLSHIYPQNTQFGGIKRPSPLSPYKEKGAADYPLPRGRPLLSFFALPISSLASFHHPYRNISMPQI